MIEDSIQVTVSAEEEQEADQFAEVSDSGPQGGDGAGFFPAPPRNLEDTGLPGSLIEHLIIKTVYFQGEVIGRDIADLLGVHFSLIAPTVELFRRRRVLEVKGSLGFGDISAVFALSEAGRTRARECLADNQYVGPAPVPLSEYADAVRRQRSASGWLTRERLEAAYAHMVLPPGILKQIGPALNSGKSLLICGQPGNGKTYLAQSLAALDAPPVFLPYAIECNGSIIQLFDPIYHQRVGGTDDWRASGYDGRWVRCKRPFIVSGGELILSMLDLGYNAAARIYDAPLQLKANNGIYLIDDFGRQRATPAEVLNRWIVPMERGLDYLTFHTGVKIEVPFEAFLIFSTNLNPQNLGDEAFLRRIEYKMHLKSPSPREFLEIFRRACRAQNLEISDRLLARFIQTHYLEVGKPFRRCHPRDLVSHAIDIIRFEHLPPELSDEVLEEAFTTCFLDSAEGESAATG